MLKGVKNIVLDAIIYEEGIIIYLYYTQIINIKIVFI
jgi:hypothetical protein